MMNEDPTLEAKQRTGNSRYQDQKPNWLGIASKSTLPKIVKPEEDPDEGDEDTPDEDEPKEDTLTAMSYSRAATMQSLMQKVSAEHKGTPVDQLMSRLNLLKY